MTITVNMTPSQLTNTKTVTLEDLNLTEEQWNKLNQEEKEEKLNEYLCTLPEQPEWMVDNFEEQ